MFVSNNYFKTINPSPLILAQAFPSKQIQTHLDVWSTILNFINSHHFLFARSSFKIISSCHTDSEFGADCSCQVYNSNFGCVQDTFNT